MFGGLSVDEFATARSAGALPPILPPILLPVSADRAGSSESGIVPAAFTAIPFVAHSRINT